MTSAVIQTASSRKETYLAGLKGGPLAVRQRGGMEVRWVAHGSAIETQSDVRIAI